MSRKIFACLLLLAATAPAAALADNGGSLVKFKGGIGVFPVSSAPGPALTAATVTRNIVRGVQPPGQIWRIDDLRADVSANGHITVDGRGLLLAGGNNIGTKVNQIVFATLICEAVAPFVERSTDATVGVPLEDDGDFHIDDVLVPAPIDCPSPVLLIRSVGGPWFAAGIVKR